MGSVTSDIPLARLAEGPQAITATFWSRPVVVCHRAGASVGTLFLPLSLALVSGGQASELRLTRDM